MGFIACTIIVVAGIWMGIMYSYVSTVSNWYNYSGGVVNTPGRSGFIGLVYIIMAAIFLFRCLYLYRFANKMRSGLQEHSQHAVNESFRNLNKMFRYNGIITVVLVLLYGVIFVVAVIIAVNR